MQQVHTTKFVMPFWLGSGAAVIVDSRGTYHRHDDAGVTALRDHAAIDFRDRGFGEVTVVVAGDDDDDWLVRELGCQGLRNREQIG